MIGGEEGLSRRKEGEGKGGEGRELSMVPDGAPPLDIASTYSCSIVIV